MNEKYLGFHSALFSIFKIWKKTQKQTNKKKKNQKATVTREGQSKQTDWNTEEGGEKSLQTSVSVSDAVLQLI